MKRIIILILFCLILCSCKEENIEYNKYLNYIEELKDVNTYDKDLPFNIDIKLDNLKDELYMYQVIIDKPIKDLYNIEALVIHDKETEDVFPTSGIFESKLHLIPNELDKENNKVKGIILIGYVNLKKENINFKVLVKTNNESFYYIKQF